jgi:hypothetical protein
MAAPERPPEPAPVGSPLSLGRGLCLERVID